MSAISQAMAWVDDVTTDTGVLAFLVFVAVVCVVKGGAIMKQTPILFTPENGWGRYCDFVPWLEAYLQACIDNPEADVEVWR